MTCDGYTIDVERIVVTGIAAGNLDATEIRAIVTESLTRSVAQSPPVGRLTVRAAVRFPGVPVSPTSDGVASAVATAVTSAAIGGGSHG